MAAIDVVRGVGPCPSVQIVAPAGSEAHELLSNPADPNGAPVTLTFHGGRTVTAPRVVNVYLGTFPDDAAAFDAFSADVVERGFYVSPDGSDTAAGTFLGSRALPLAAGGTLTDVLAQDLLHAALDAGHLPPADQNTAYALVIPPGVEVVADDGHSTSCAVFCGYHSRTSRGVYYWIVCDPGCSGCHGTYTPQQARQMVWAHEYGEWRSDPDGTGWYADGQGEEDGDICAWQLVPWGPGEKWAVQPLSVNGRGCVVGAYRPPAQQPERRDVPEPAFSGLGAPFWRWLWDAASPDARAEIARWFAWFQSKGVA